MPQWAMHVARERPVVLLGRSFEKLSREFAFARSPATHDRQCARLTPCRSADDCSSWDTLLRLPDPSSRKQFFEGLVWACWSILAFELYAAVVVVVVVVVLSRNTLSATPWSRVC